MSKDRQPKADKNQTNPNEEINQSEISELDQVKQELENEKERRLRVMADFENFKKRIEGEKAMFGAMANMGLIQEILEINDDLQLALDDSDLDLDRAKSSITTAQEKLKATVRNAGIDAIEIKVGDDFDSNTMEAIQAVPDEKNAGKVIAVISSAYKYADKDGILKAAKVIVGK
ncbi:nucleotide exchange factor GrpE [Candidatus Dojkabacteria bacterium]|uniref:Protein GrpE n=1 Tax=Candidatus Dojkabacteria bacterium TaxID=2099670 RepID=A0A955L1B4_9BACT|nr:nucleotide exchange factor GrpE [Candidatus Dojkabacteria bacterium]